MYRVAVMDWSGALRARDVLTWQLSNTLDGAFCVDALRQALLWGKPEIFNTDPGVQFTAHAFTDMLTAAGIQIRMDAPNGHPGRAFANIFNERLWRSVK